MPRPRKTEEEKKQSITISMPGWLLVWLRGHSKFPSHTIEALLLEYKEKLEKKD